MPMDLDLAQEIFWIQFWHFLALIVSLYLNGILMEKAEKSPLRNRYIAVQTCLLIWIVSKILKTISFQVDLRWLFIVTQYLGVSFLGPCFFLFSHMTVKNRNPRKWNEIFLLSGGGVCFLMVLTNPLHFLFYSSYDFYGDQFGPLFYVIMTYQYSLMILSFIILARKIVLNNKTAIQERLIGVAALIPFGINIAYVFDIINPLFDITPIGMTFSLGFFALAAFRYRFLGVVYQADRIIREGIKDPLLVFDRENRLLSYPAPSHPLGLVHGYRKINPGETVLCEEHYYRLMKREKKRGWTLEYWADVSPVRRLEIDRKKAIDRLEKLEKEIHEGNLVLLEKAREEAIRHTQLELHDTLGHSLTQIILLLRSAQVLERTDNREVHNTLKKTAALCLQNLKEISTPRKNIFPAWELLSSGLYQLAENFSDSPVTIRVTIRGNEIPLSKEMNHILLRCCQEAVTNGLKHGKAEHIDLILRFNNKSLLLIIADRGAGCETIIPGMGLTGMKERLSPIQGILRYQGEPGGGVMVSIHVPLPPKNTAQRTA